MSESPTHPDAPRAGGETPESFDLLTERGLTYLSEAGSERAYAMQDQHPDDAALMAKLAFAVDKLRERRPDHLRQAFVVETVKKVAAALGFASDPIADQQSLVEHAEALRASLLERHRDGERWQPATSAPKTGEHVLVTCLNEGGFGFCGGKRQDWCAVVHYWDVAGEEGFYLSSGASSPFDDYALRFTHWRPLPVMCLCDYNLADAPSVLHQPPCPLSAPPAASEPTEGASNAPSPRSPSPERASK